MFNDYQKLKTILGFPLTQLKHYMKKKIFRYFTDVSLPFWLSVCIKKKKTSEVLFLFSFFKIFLIWTILKVFIAFVTMKFLLNLLLLLLLCFVFWPGGIRGPCSLTRDQTHTPCFERWNINHWTAREFPRNPLIIKVFYKLCIYKDGQHHILSFFSSRIKSRFKFETTKALFQQTERQLYQHL